MKRYKLLCLTFPLALFACKKHDDPTRTDMLTNGKWHITANTLSADLGTGTPLSIDIYATQQPCTQDNLSIFRNDNHLILDEGPSMCATGGSQQTDQGSWAFTDNDTRLSITNTGFVLNYKVSSMDASKMVLQYDTTVFGFSGTNTVTYMHQD